MINCIIVLIFLLIYIKKNSNRSGFTSINSDMRGQKIKIWDSKNGWIVKSSESLGDNTALKIYTSDYTIFYKSKSSVEDLPALIGALPATKYKDLYSSGDIYLEIIPLELAKQLSTKFKIECEKNNSEEICKMKYLL